MIPVAIVGIFFRDQVASFFTGNIVFVGAMLLVTAALLMMSSFIRSGSRKVSYLDSIVIGIAQALAVLPGISRSGFTVSTILFEKYEQDQSLKFSFLMSVPVVLASIGIDIIFGEGSVLGTIDILTILVVTAISFIVGYLSMEVLLKIAQKINFSYFCILYGVISFTIIVPFMIFG